MRRSKLWLELLEHLGLVSLQMKSSCTWARTAGRQGAPEDRLNPEDQRNEKKPKQMMSGDQIRPGGAAGLLPLVPLCGKRMF